MPRSGFSCGFATSRDPTLVGARQLHPSKLTVRRLQQSFAECQTSAKRFASRDAPTLLNYYAAAPANRRWRNDECAQLEWPLFGGSAIALRTAEAALVPRSRRSSTC